MKRLKLTKQAKVLAFGVVVVATAFGVVKFGFGKDDKVSSDKLYEQAGNIVKEEETLNISLDEWIGLKV
jgi:hypothetical protein